KDMGLLEGTNAVLVLIQLCEMSIFNFYLQMFMYSPFSSITGFISHILSKCYKSNISELKIYPSVNNKLNIGLCSPRRQYSTLKNSNLVAGGAENLQSSIKLPFVAKHPTFLQWFVGFTDAEGNFIINPLKNTKLDISRFSFMFKITLHKDDSEVLIYIKDKLGVGGVRYYKDECIFNVTNKEGIALLISIFDKYNLNTTKHLDFLDFKEAFYLYWNREENSDACGATLEKEKILNLKNKMNTNRVDFDRPKNSPVLITRSWLLGFIEGDGSFFIRRDTLTPTFAIEVSGVQFPVLVEIKQFLDSSLGFDKYSLFKLKNSSIISVNMNKSKNNSKSSTSIIINNISILNNYFIPFFNETEFLTKKGKDFKDFKLISKIIYIGGHRKEDIRSLILKLTNTMNNFRLSTNKEKVQNLTSEEMDLLLKSSPTVERLFDGRVIDSSTKKILPKLNSCVYEIICERGDQYMANSLSEAASIINIYPDTLSKYLDIEASATNLEVFVDVKTYKVRRVRVLS
uniref:homing endonuclease n=1 Tax=Leptographium wingfieldii TaxID=155675 RepID=UPI0023EFA8B8